MSGEPTGSSQTLVNLRRIVSRKRYEELEGAWMAALEDPSVGAGDLLATLRVLARREFPGTEGLLWFLLTDRAERTGPREAIDLARRAAGLPPAQPADAFLPDTDLVREELASLYRRASPDTPNIERLIQITLLRKAVPVAQALDALEKLFVLAPGRYVLDAERKEPGRVTGLKADEDGLEVAFESGPRTYDAPAVGRLEILEADDFRALLAFERERLAALVQGDPAGLVVLLLTAYGPFLTFRELKARLAPVVPAATWSRWWADARPALKRAPLIQMSDDAAPTFGLRTRPVAHEDDLRALFVRAPSPEARFAIVLDYLAETASAAHPASAALVGLFASELAASAESLREGEPILACAALVLGAEMHQRFPETVPAPTHPLDAVLFPDGRVPAAFTPISNDALARFVLGRIRERCPERWPEVYSAALPGSSQETCEWLATELSNAGRDEAIHNAVPAILGRPEAGANALMWLWRAVAAGRFPAALEDLDGAVLAVRLLAAADTLTRRDPSPSSPERQTAQQIVKLLASRDHEALRSVLQRADVEQVRFFRGAIERSAALTEHARNDLLDVVRHARPGLFAKAPEPWEEDVIYTTKEGLQRRQQELYELVHVKLAEASKAVGTAAADGDLSENFAWTAALAERDRLGTIATRMQEEVRKARVIPPTLPQVETVTIGSSVDVRHCETGALKTFIFLGPWDADHDRCIYGYNASLGLAFMGKKKGDVVAVDSGPHEDRWEILAVRPAPNL